MGEGTDRPMGERRRRREAERAAARAAEQAGATRPLTRRELRWQQAEEAARLEAIATGELPLGDLQEAAAAPSSAGSTTADPSSPAPAAEDTSVPTAGSPEPSASSGSAASAASVTTAESAPSSDPAPSRVPSRRSLRERAEDTASAPPERPQERTATGRRPVVRTPSTAQGVRSLDATGRLTGIQPVVRPDTRQPGEPADDQEDAASGAWSERATFSVDLDGPAQAARAALPPEPAAPAEEAPHEADDDGDDAFSMRPQWVAISGISGATPDEAKSDLPSRRSVRSRMEESAPSPEPAVATEPPNPAVTAIKIAVLVVVAAVIGALIWLLATEAFDDEAAGATPAPIHSIAPDPEESSAR